MPDRRGLGADGKIGNPQQGRAGFSLVEMLVVIFVFSILGVVTVQILTISLRNSKKSKSIGGVRANLEYATSTMERLLRNAQSLTCVLSPPPPTNSIRLNYVDEYGNSTYFRCVTSGSDTYIASGSAAAAVRLTSNDVRITCSNIFSCTYPTDAPEIVSITLTGQDAELGTSVEGAGITVRTRLQLRNY